MAKLKQEKDALSALLSATANNSQIINTNISTSNDIIDKVEADPLLKFDKEDELKKIRKKCRNTVKEIARAVLPAEVIKTTAIQDKIENDAMSMVGLHWQLRLSEIMQDGITESISKGNMSPRMIEVFTNLMEKITQVNKQLLATEVQMRKNYLDFKTDMFEKMQEEMSVSKNINNQLMAGNGDNKIYRGTKTAIQDAKNRMINAIKNDVDFSELKKESN